MDLDVVHRQVQGLIAFRTKVEQFISNAGHDIEAEAGVSSLGDRVAALEAKSGSAPAGDTTGLADRISALEGKFDDLSTKVADLPAILDGVSKLADLAAQKDRLLAAADWVDQNGQQVAELLKIGDDLAPAAGTANAGAAAATGAVAGDAAPGAAVYPTAAAAAPATGAGT